jgi:protein-tyrosine phosphatase
MAAAIASAKLGTLAIVRSAGLECGTGLFAAQNAIQAMAERDLDISGHRSTDVDDLDLTEFDLIVAMTPEIARRLAPRNPTRLESWDVPDPYGGDIAIYRTAAANIDAELERLSL